MRKNPWWLMSARLVKNTGARQALILLVVIVLAAGTNVQAATTIPDTEEQALVAMYDSTNGPGWYNHSGWKVDPDPCQWSGVACSYGHVTELDLSSINLTGHIPAEIGNLTKLAYLDVGENQLSGSIPPEIGKLTSLTHLFFLNNRLTGAIPPEIGNLAKLEELDLSKNQLSGAIPSDIWRLISLKGLGLSDNQLSGAISPKIGNLAKLEGLDLSKNQLSGAIPSDIWRLISLKGLGLSGNQLSGAIPPEIGNLTNLIGLGLGDNQLSGAIPPEIGNLTNLYGLGLEGNQLSGSIPSEIGNLTMLVGFDLSRNQLRGAVPLPVARVASGFRLNLLTGQGGTCNLINNDFSLCLPNTPAYRALGVNPLCGLPLSSSCSLPPPLVPLPAAEKEALIALYENTNGPGWRVKTGWETDPEPCLWYGVTCSEAGHVISLYLSGNRLSGHIPPEIGNLTSLDELVLSSQADPFGGSSQLGGIIPPEIGNLIRLTSLDLQSNQLSGAIPAEIGNLTSLKEMNLSSNQLSGALPAEIGKLASLKAMNLSSNQLSGAIPAEIGKLTSLKAMNLSSNQLSGAIPAETGNLTKLVTMDLPDNKLSGTIPPEIGNLASILRLDLSTNQLSGAIPPEIGNLASLEKLYLSSNQLSGALPAEMRKLDRLYEMFVNNNQLSGTIPLSVAQLATRDVTTYLTNCDFTQNESSFCLPDTIDYQEIGKNPLCGLSLSSVCVHLPTLLPTAEQQALVALYDNTNGPSWTYNKGWKVYPDPCSWSRVDCAAGHVTSLVLSYNGLIGVIPPEIGYLTDLVQLDLSSNKLSGAIPPEIGNLNLLTQLDLSDNQLSGSIPPEIGELPRLTQLALYRNQLSGAIPPEIGNLASLNQLSLSGNQLSGAIPPEIGNLSSLEELNLFGNQLSGAIPPEIGNLSSLEVLYLFGNQLSGTIPLPVAQLAPNLCDFTNNDSSLCLPNTTRYQAIGKNPLCGLYLSDACVGPPDRDNDGTPDAQDAFPDDPALFEPGITHVDYLRVDGGDIAANLVDGKPKSDLYYRFRATIDFPAAGKVWLLLDGYPQQMDCGPEPVDFRAQVGCTFDTLLGPAGSHRYRVEIRDNTAYNPVQAPLVESNDIPGPVIELLNGSNMVGLAKDPAGIGVGLLDSFGSSQVHGWVSDGLTTGTNNGHFVAYDNTQSGEPGKGYFLKREGNSRLTDLSGYPELAAPSLTIALQPGWNLISNPYGGQVNLTALQVQRNSEPPVGWLEACAGHWLTNSIYHYTGSDWGSQYAFASAGGNPEAQLTPWVGYWIYVIMNDADYKLIVPKP